MAKADRFIPTLDGWRAIAVLLVIFCHELMGRSQFGSFIGFIIMKIGPLGVQIFFAISGYLICTLLLMEADRSGISLKAFYTRRAFRILPPALTYLAVLSAIATLGFVVVHIMDVVSCVFLFANYYKKSWPVQHFWSLSVEEHFYLLWPAMLAFLRWKRAAWACVAGIIVIGSWRLWVGDARYITASNPWQRTDMVLDAFFAPCLLAILLHNVPAVRPSLQRWLSPVAVIGMCLMLAVLTGLPVPVALKKSVQALVLPLVVVSTVLNPSTWLGRVLEFPVLTWIGRVSYSLYLWQQLLTSPYLPLTTLPIRLGALFGIAAISYRFIEQPLIAYGRKIITRHRAAEQQSAAVTASGV